MGAQNPIMLVPLEDPPSIGDAAGPAPKSSSPPDLRQRRVGGTAPIYRPPISASTTMLPPIAPRKVDALRRSKLSLTKIDPQGIRRRRSRRSPSSGGAEAAKPLRAADEQPGDGAGEQADQEQARGCKDHGQLCARL